MTERIFRWPGLGELAVVVQNRDAQAIVGVTLVASTAVVISTPARGSRSCGRPAGARSRVSTALRPTRRLARFGGRSRGSSAARRSASEALRRVSRGARAAPSRRAWMRPGGPPNRAPPPRRRQRRARQIGLNRRGDRPGSPPSAGKSPSSEARSAYHHAAVAACCVSAARRRPARGVGARELPRERGARALERAEARLEIGAGALEVLGVGPARARELDSRAGGDEERRDELVPAVRTPSSCSPRTAHALRSSPRTLPRTRRLGRASQGGLRQHEVHGSDRLRDVADRQSGRERALRLFGRALSGVGRLLMTSPQTQRTVVGVVSPSSAIRRSRRERVLGGMVLASQVGSGLEATSFSSSR